MPHARQHRPILITEPGDEPECHGKGKTLFAEDALLTHKLSCCDGSWH